MKKIILLCSVILFAVSFNNGFAQGDLRLNEKSNGEVAGGFIGYPSWILGISLGSNLAVNDAYGRISDLSTYGMKSGRSVDINFKYGLGTRKKSRITVRAGYTKMINDDRDRFFLVAPVLMNPDPPHSFYDIITGAIGYEYVFGSPCCNKQTLGIAFTFNNISAPDYNSVRGKIDGAMRIGIELNAGYEFMLGKSGKTGLALGFRYNQLNAFNSSNATGVNNYNLNDGDGAGGAGFSRKIGIFSVTLGLNLYGK